MIIFLYGPDTYRSRQKLNEIIEHYKKIHQSGLNLKYFDGEKLSFQEFKDQFQSVSMFAEKKLIILEKTIKNKDFKEKFLAKPKRFIDSDDLILFYERGEIPSNDSFFEFLKKSSQWQEFKLLEGEKLKNWTKKELKKYQINIDSKALEELLNFVGNDLWQMTNEIKKLVSYSFDKKIEVKDVNLLVRPAIEPEIFKTIDALASKNKKQALDLLHKHLEKGDNPLYLLSMINYQFRNLLIVKEMMERNLPYYLILKKAQLNPWVVRKSYQQADKFTLAKLKQIYQKIFQADLDIKTGKLDPQLALDLLITDI